MDAGDWWHLSDDLIEKVKHWHLVDLAKLQTCVIYSQPGGIQRMARPKKHCPIRNICFAKRIEIYDIFFIA
jgi:hypothetical protein